MNPKKLAEKVFDQMFETDYFSKWLGIEKLEIDAGKSVLRLKIRKEMLNGFGIAHGGITYCLADSALAFACNSHGRKTVSVETSVSHVVALKEGDIITAYAEEESKTNKIGVYRVIIKREEEVVAVFKGVVYRTSKEWKV